MESSKDGTFRSIQDIPLPFRSVFEEYPCFNIVQSAVLDQALQTDNSLVVSAPTGSGKTAIFEMAMVRYLMQRDESPSILNNKIIYISPIKALCREKLIDWHKKFTNFGVKSITMTSDTDDIDARNIEQYNLILTTPEKWDVLTRRWRHNNKLVGSISLFLIDEVHLLNADTRGSTLEVIVSRMKTAMTSMNQKQHMRFIALSATIPNIEDIAEWIGPSGTAKYYRFSEDVRPVKLNKVVIGFYFNPQNQSIFKFDMSLSYKLSGLINRYSDGKPTLVSLDCLTKYGQIFCNTRKSVEMTTNQLVSNLQIHLSQEQKNSLMHVCAKLSDPKLKQCVAHGIAFHHAGLIYDNRSVIEESFRQGILPVLVTTSTLAMGVNLPAHLVIVKSTKCYTDGGYKDYDEVSIFQMIGRAGRCQFDTSATALILTSRQDQAKYEQMLSCNQTIESNLHKHLTEHLNAEVVLRTITDLEVAMRWLSSTFLYVRATRSPEKYKLPAGLSKEKIDRKLLEMCQIDLNKLVRAGMVKMSQDIEVGPTQVGEIMAKYYVAFDTMKLFTLISGNEILMQILSIISRCKEFSEIYLRTSDKRCLNLLNKNSNKESNRFPLAGRIKTADMKINVIIQAVLGNLDIHDQSLLSDSFKILKNCERLTKCLIEYLETRDKCYSALLNSVILAKCFTVKLWENSPYVSKQLTGVGQVISSALSRAGKTSFKEIASTNPRIIEMVVGRKPPFGNTIVDEATHIPQYSVNLTKCGNTAELRISLLNSSCIEQKSTVNLDSLMTLLVGDSDNNLLLYEKYAHTYMLENPEVTRTIAIDRTDLLFIKADFVSENWVGIDCFSKLQLSSENSVEYENNKQNMKQTFLDMYLQHVKKNNYNKKEKVVKVLGCQSSRASKVFYEQKIAQKSSSNCAPNDSMAHKLPDRQEEEVGTKEKENQPSSTAPDLKEPKPAAKNDQKAKKKTIKVSNSIFRSASQRSTAQKRNRKKESVHLSDSFETTIMNEIEKDSNQIESNTGGNTNLEHNQSAQSNIGKDECRESQSDSITGATPKTGKMDNREYGFMTDQDRTRKKLDMKYGVQTPVEFKKRTPPRDVFNFSLHSGIDVCDSSPFEGIPTKSIKWRSPLVHATPEKALFLDCEDRTFENGYPNVGPKLGSANTSSSSSNMFDALDSRLSTSAVFPSGKSAKKKPKAHFPLSDRECGEERDSFSQKMKGLDEICDLEYFGLANKKEPSVAPSKSCVGKYYSQLLVNSQENTKFKPQENKSEAPHYGERANENFPQSPEIFSQNSVTSSSNRFHAPRVRQNDTNEREYAPVQTITQPVPMEYYHRQAQPKNSEIGDAYTQKFEYLNSCSPYRRPPHRHFFSNPYLRSPPQLQRPYYLPMPNRALPRPCTCWGCHRRPYYPEEDPYPRFSPYKHPHRHSHEESVPIWSQGQLAEPFVMSQFEDYSGIASSAPVAVESLEPSLLETSSANGVRNQTSSVSEMFGNTAKPQISHRSVGVPNFATPRPRLHVLKPNNEEKLGNFNCFEDHVMMPQRSDGYSYSVSRNHQLERPMNCGSSSFQNYRQ